MDERIRDCRIAHRESIIVSVSPDFLVQPVEIVLWQYQENIIWRYNGMCELAGGWDYLHC